MDDYLLIIDPSTGTQLKELLPINSGGGVAGVAGKVIRLDADGRIDLSFLPLGIGPDFLQAPASEALAAGDYVQPWNDAGTLKVRKADAATNKRAWGFVTAAVPLNDPATVYFEGPNDKLAGLLAGTEYFLSATTPGAVTSSPPAAGSGFLWQSLGLAVSATTINNEIGKPVQR